jgi:signal transduction histidine kinase
VIDKRYDENGPHVVSTRHILPAWLLVALVVWLWPHAAAAAPVVVDGRAEQRSLLDHLDALVDPDGTLDVTTVAARDLRPIQALEESIGRWPGQRQPIVWIRAILDVRPEATAEPWFLVIGRPYNPGTVYIEEADGHYRAVELRLAPDGGSFRVELPRAAGLRRVFLRIPAPISRPSLLHVATADGQEQLLEGLLTGQGLYLGVMLAMLLVNLLVGVALRDRTQLWYVAFGAASVATFALLTGTASRLILTTAPASALYRPQDACLAFTVFAGVQFSRLFLDTPRVAPKNDRVLRAFQAFAALVFAASWLAPDVLATRAVALLGVLVPPVALSAGVAAFRAGSRWARFYLVGWTVFSIGGFLFAAPLSLPVLDGLAAFQLSSALEAALFSVALVDRLRVLRGERAQAERALARSEVRLQSIFDGTIEATWLLDGEARVVEINDTAKQRWRTTAEAARGQALATLPPWPRAQTATARLADALARVRAGAPVRFEAAFGEAASASVYDVSVKAIDPGLTLVEARDVTELKQAELKAARAEKLAALGQLVAGVAHEVNNPNNFLTFNLPIVQDYLEATRPYVEAAERERGDVRLFGLGVVEFYTDATALVGHMQHGAERIAGIVSQLKSYVRQGDEAQWEDADVNRVVGDAATLVRTQLRQQVEHFELHLDEGLPRVRMNPGRVEQVVMNLLLNAGHAAGASPGGRVDVWTRREGGHVLITVEDTGPGVPEAIRERIFEPFFTTKAGEQGTGMGLAISQRIVDEHGGTLELASGGARGAHFVVRLPVSVEHT